MHNIDSHISFQNFNYKDIRCLVIEVKRNPNEVFVWNARLNYLPY